MQTKQYLDETVCFKKRIVFFTFISGIGSYVFISEYICWLYFLSRDREPSRSGSYFLHKKKELRTNYLVRQPQFFLNRIKIIFRKDGYTFTALIL